MTRNGDSRFGIAALLAGAALLAVLRCLLAVRLDLAPDEAWYWIWSRNLAISYPDHPPGVAYLIRLGTHLLGDTPIGIRAATIALGLAGTVLLFFIARLAGLAPRRAAAAALLGSLLPVPAAGGLIATPDAPLGLVWLASAGLLVRITEADEPPSGHFAALGLLLGLGLWFKHSALLLPAAAAITLALRGGLSSRLRRRGPWIGLAAAALAAAPYLIAEVASGLPSIGARAAHLTGALPGGGAGGIAGLAERLGGLLAGQIGLLGPVVFGLLVWVAARRAPQWPELTALLVLIATPLAATMVAALLTHPEQNWASLGHPLAPLVILTATKRARDSGLWSPRKERFSTWCLALSVLAASAVVHLHAARPFLPLPPERDPVSRLHGFAGLSGEIASLEEARGAEAWICDDYGLAAALVFDARERAASPVVFSTDRPWPVPARFERALLLDLEGDWAGARPEVDCAALGPPRIVERRRADGTVVGRITARSGDDCVIPVPPISLADTIEMSSRY